MSVGLLALVLCVAPLDVDGGLSADVVGEVVAWHDAEARTCLKAGAPIVARWTVGAEGVVSDVSAAPKNACLTKVVSKWLFPTAVTPTTVSAGFDARAPVAGPIGFVGDGGVALFDETTFPPAWETARSCLAEAHAADSKAEGLVRLDFVVGRTGRVLESNVSRVEPLLTGVDACLVRASRSWLFPAGAPQRVRSAWLFGFSQEQLRAVPVSDPMTIPVWDEGGLDKEVIQPIIKSHAGAVRACYERALIERPSLTGALTVAWTINEAGAVTRAPRAQHLGR